MGMSKEFSRRERKGEMIYVEKSLRTWRSLRGEMIRMWHKKKYLTMLHDSFRKSDELLDNLMKELG